MNRIELLENELDRLLQWVRAAESRLALILPLSTAMLGALAVSVPNAFEWSTFSAIVAAFAFFFLALSLLFCVFATYPRTTGPKGSLIFFGGIDALEQEQYADAVRTLTEENYTDDLIKQCYRNAQIATRKYSWVQKSMACLFLGAGPWAVSLFSLYIEM